MNDILLKETAKHIDIVDTSLCSFVWRVCNYKQFEGMRGSDFGYLLNLREPLPRVKMDVCAICFVRFQSILKTLFSPKSG